MNESLKFTPTDADASGIYQALGLTDVRAAELRKLAEDIIKTKHAAGIAGHMSILSEAVDTPKELAYVNLIYGQAVALRQCPLHSMRDICEKEKEEFSFEEFISFLTGEKKRRRHPLEELIEMMEKDAVNDVKKGAKVKIVTGRGLGDALRAMFGD